MPTQKGTKNASPKTQKKVGEVRVAYRVRSKLAKPPSPNAIVKKCRAILAQAYGERFKGLILYGSRARKTAAPSSDIDLLVLLAPPLDYFTELRRLVDVLYPVQLESEQLISAKPVSIDDFEKGSLSLYRNAKREGIPVK
jgi:predicted nucleotidyltransferase